MQRRLLVLLILLPIWWSSCTTTTTTEDSFTSAFDIKEKPPEPQKIQGGGGFKNAMTNAQALAFGAGNAAKSAAQNVGKGAGWVAEEFIRPLNSMREGMIDAFGVAQPEKK